MAAHPIDHPEQPRGPILQEVLKAHPAFSVFRKSNSVPSIRELAEDDAPPTSAGEPSIMANYDHLLTEDNLMGADLPSFSVNDSSLNLPEADSFSAESAAAQYPSTPRPAASAPMEAPRSILKRAPILPPTSSPPRPLETPRTVKFSASTALPAPSPDIILEGSALCPPFYDQSEGDSEVIILGGSPLEQSDEPLPMPKTPTTFADLLDSDEEDSRSFQRLSPGIGLHMSRNASAPVMPAVMHRPPIRGTRSDAHFLDRLRAAIPTPDGSIDEAKAMFKAGRQPLASPTVEYRPDEGLGEDSLEELADAPSAPERSAEVSYFDDSLPEAEPSADLVQPEASTSQLKPLPPTPITSPAPNSPAQPRSADPETPAHHVSPLAGRRGVQGRISGAMSLRSNISVSEFGVLGLDSPEDDENGVEVLKTPARAGDQSRAGDLSIYATPGNATMAGGTVFLSPMSSPDSSSSLSARPAMPSETRASPLLMKRVSQQALVLHERSDVTANGSSPGELIAAQDDLLQARAAERTLLLSLVDTLRADLAARDEEIVQVKQQRDRAEQAWEDAFDEASKWEAEYGDRSKAHQEAKRRRIEALDGQLRAEMERLTAQADRATALEEERDALLLRVEVASTPDDDVREQVVALQQDLEAVERRAEEATARADGLEFTVSTATQRHESAERHLELERRRVEDLTVELARAQDRATEAESALEQSHGHDEQTVELEQQVETLQRELARGSSDASDSHRAAIARLERELAQSEEQRKRGDEVLRRTTTELAEVREKEGRASAELASLGTVELENARLRDDLVTATSSVHSPCASCAGRTRQMEELRQVVRKAQAESADQGVTIAKLQKAKSALKEDREGLLIALEAKQQELSLLKRRGSDAHRVKEGRRSSIAPPTTIRATSKASSRSSVMSATRKQLPPTPSIYEETPSRPQLTDRRAAGSALYAVARRPGGSIDEKENRVPMLA